MIQMEKMIMMRIMEIVEAKTTRFQRGLLSLKIFKKNIDWTMDCRIARVKIAVTAIPPLKWKRPGFTMIKKAARVNTSEPANPMMRDDSDLCMGQ